MKQNQDIKVFISSKDSTCDECHEELGRKAWITLEKDKGALCLSCADLDHLEFLPSGDAALTRRSRKYSTLVAVVLKWSRARKRYERQGLLVEARAVEKAEDECLADKEIRERRKARDAERRALIDEQYVAQFAKKARDMYPMMPPKRDKQIAEHACMKYSGRVGRTSFAKQFEPDAIRLAMNAHIRHAETNYDELLVTGHDRWDARSMIEKKVQDVLLDWQGENC